VIETHIVRCSMRDQREVPRRSVSWIERKRERRKELEVLSRRGRSGVDDDDDGCKIEMQLQFNPLSGACLTDVRMSDVSIRRWEEKHFLCQKSIFNSTRETWYTWQLQENIFTSCSK